MLYVWAITHSGGSMTAHGRMCLLAGTVSGVVSMRRWLLFAVALLAIWGLNQLLPAANPEEQLRSLTKIVAQSGSNSLQDVNHELPRVAATSQTGLPSDFGSPALVIELQDQLRRVGCYKGPIDGRWSPATRRALARFNDRIDLHASFDQPLPTMLPVIGKFGDRACGTPCPAGSRPDGEGACMTLQTVASAAPTVSRAKLESAKPAAPSMLTALVIVAPGRVVIDTGYPAKSAPLPPKWQVNAPPAIDRPASIEGEKPEPVFEAAGSTQPSTPVPAPPEAVLALSAIGTSGSLDDAAAVAPELRQAPGPALASPVDLTRGKLKRPRESARSKARIDQVVAWSRKHRDAATSAYGFSGGSGAALPLSIVLSKR